MNQVEERIAQVRAEGRTGLMTHLVVGYPAVDRTVGLALALAEAGADLIELQIPFSDPIADGPTIMRACDEALKRGARVQDAFVAAEEIAARTQLPIVFMSYYNLVHQYGIPEFCAHARDAGVSALIIPDLPVEAALSEGVSEACRKSELAGICVVSPASTDERLRKNAELASGFVYCTARQGITGARAGLNPQIGSYLENVRRHFQIPIAAGFGISSKERLDLIRPYCDIAITGSAIIDIMDADSGAAAEKKVGGFVKALLSPT
jgi:tryptophan synthase alpha chain